MYKEITKKSLEEIKNNNVSANAKGKYDMDSVDTKELFENCLTHKEEGYYELTAIEINKANHEVKLIDESNQNHLISIDLFIEAIDNFEAESYNLLNTINSELAITFI